jgi:hypothetical protein
MKTIRILSLILALLMLAIPFVACQEEPTEAPDETPDAADDATELAIVKKGETKYKIIFDYMAGPLTRENVLVLQKAFKDYLGCDDVEVLECFSDREDPDEKEPTAKEILIGITNRPESAEVAKNLKVGDFSIQIIGEKLVIAGGSDQSTANAINRFCTAFVYEQGNRFEVAKGTGAVFSLNVKAEDLADYTASSKYSYDKATLGDARIDSYLITVPAQGNMSATYREFAEQYKTYIFDQVGYEMELKEDAQVVKADYKILIGDTTFTDASIVNAREDDEYYISFAKTENGGVLTIVFGRDAYDIAWNAYKEIMPSSSTPIDFHLSDGFVKTNMQ